jgi:hypothetical protein
MVPGGMDRVASIHRVDGFPSPMGSPFRSLGKAGGTGGGFSRMQHGKRLQLSRFGVLRTDNFGQT